MGDAFGSFKQQVRDAVDEYLTQCFTEQSDSEVLRAAKYAVLTGGHRWRALVAVAAGRVFTERAMEIVLPSAVGVELAHAASLVLDDLPSMDDAQMRRGKPCVHVVFPRWATDMLPVYLVTLGYKISLANPHASYERRVRCALDLSEAGLRMIQGQEYDLRSDGNRQDARQWLLTCYELKTGVLFAAAAKAGAVLCGASDEEAAAFERCGMNLGISFQFQDDVADKVAAFEQIGKDAGNDKDKLTAVQLFGVQGARDRARDLERSALSRLESYGATADLLRRLITEANWTSS